MMDTSIHSLHKAFGNFIPVWALSREIPEPTPHIPTPEIGIRWGRPANLRLTTSSHGDNDVGGDDPEEEEDEDPPPDINVIRFVSLSAAGHDGKNYDFELDSKDRNMYIAVSRSPHISFHFQQTLDQQKDLRWKSVTWTYNLQLVLHPEPPAH